MRLEVNRPAEPVYQRRRGPCVPSSASRVLNSARALKDLVVFFELVLGVDRDAVVREEPRSQVHPADRASANDPS